MAFVMDGNRKPYRVLVYEAIGFAVILAMMWLDEFLGFPESYLRGGAPHPPEWAEAGVETAAILAVAIPTLLLTRRLLSRVFRLERFLKICAWCRKINDADRWMSVEDYFSAGFGARTSHGMCPDCYEKAKRG